MENIFVEFLPPWVETGLQPAFYDKESGTVLQQTARMYARVNMLIRMFNKLSKQTKETVDTYIASFNELHDYVHDYFDNLDVQEEINNKLDDMAGDGTLQQIIMDYLNNKIKVITPLYNKDGTDTLGSCTIVECYDKSVMIDCNINDAVVYSGITEAMYENDISKLDYLIISHYHSDHYGNYQRLFNSGYLDGCTVILPRNVSNDYIDTTTESTAIKQFLNDNSINWIEADNDSISFNDMTMNIYNSSAEDYAHYDALGDISYNNYSMVVEFLYNNRKVLVSGDCEYYGCEYITSKYLHSNYDIVQDSHHSFSGCSVTYLNQVAPRYVICPTSVGMINKNISRRGSLILGWDVFTPNIYVVGVQPETLVFNVGNDNIVANKSAIANPDFGSLATINYYLDYTTTESRRDGSENFPFKSLEEAAALMIKNSNANITLHVLNLEQVDTEEIRFNGFKRLTIDFDNEELDNQILFSNIPFLTLSNVNLTGYSITIENCNVVIDGFTSTSNANNPLIINRSHAQLRGDYSFTNQIANCMFIEYSTVSFVFNSLTFNQTSTDDRIFQIYETTIEMSANTENVLKEFKPVSELTKVQYLRYFSKFEKILTLFEHTDEANSDTIYLRDETTNMGGIKVICKNDNNYLTVIMPQEAEHSLISFLQPSSDKSTIYANTGILNLMYRNSMNITRSGQLNIGVSGTTRAGDDKITIMKVIAIPA